MTDVPEELDEQLSTVLGRHYGAGGDADEILAALEEHEHRWETVAAAERGELE